MPQEWRTILQTRSTRVWNVNAYIAQASGSTPYEIGTAYVRGSTATSQRQRAGEMIGAGYLALCLFAETVTSSRTRRFYRATTPYSGVAAGMWFAHAYLDLLAEAQHTQAILSAQTALREHFPLSPEARESQAAMGDDEADLVYFGVGIVLGAVRTAKLPFFRDLESAGPGRLVKSTQLLSTWRRGARTMFSLVDPDGCRRWEEAAGVP